MTCPIPTTKNGKSWDENLESFVLTLSVSRECSGPAGS